MYALIKNGAVDKYPYTFAMLRKDNPNVSYPRSYDIARADDVVLVQDTAKPDYDLTKNITEGTPQEFAGVWLRVWTEVPASAEEIAGRQADAAIVADRFFIKAVYRYSETGPSGRSVGRAGDQRRLPGRHRQDAHGH